MSNKCILCFKILKNKINICDICDICDIFDKCIESDNVYSITTCIDIFDLNYKHLENLKTYHDINNNKYYGRKDIIQIISLQNNISIKKSSIKLKEKKRRLNLIDKMKMNKLDQINNSVYRTHIKFGYPTIDETINLLLENQNDENKKIYTLLDALENNNMEYNPKLPCYLNYIKNKCSLKNTLEIAETELYLAENTEYIKLLEKYDNESAKEIALFNYCKEHNSKNTYHTIFDTKLNFD
jgi:hypothetical protein